MRKEDSTRLSETCSFERSERLYEENNAWFFTIRQGASFGPYETKQHAERHLNSFVSLLA